MNNQKRKVKIDEEYKNDQFVRRIQRKVKNIESKNIDDEQNTSLVREALFYRFKGCQEQQNLMEMNGKMECPICKLMVKNLQLHLNKTPCFNRVDMDHFETNYELY